MSQISNRTAILPARPQAPLNGNDEPAPLDANGKIGWEAFMEWVDEDTRPDWLWQQTLPEVNRVMFQIAGTAYSTYLMQKAAEEGVNFPPNA